MRTITPQFDQTLIYSDGALCLQVTLTDSGTPPLSSTVQVVVVVKDENDNSPQFDQTFYHIMIPEVQNKESTFIIQNEVDASESDLEFEALFVGEAWHSLDSDNLTGYPVFRLLAVDSDCDNNGKVQYQVKSSHDRFSIHQHSGVVFAQRPVLANHDFDLLVSKFNFKIPGQIQLRSLQDF
ncbi:hypothetical protein J6590_091802 [Homalodisca vitripennis]|nr:hypothetical protein J6590_090778 [Homalodisca vitripennis]KAG8314609.1 hypothetical protein J6590_088932 [Homalodisca vitripennis]KAG8324457.1 hypothetical protein J6590_091802 [Homalodisca vitripennis]